ncbi:MAG: 6-bladed beta-propeller [Gemmatimonadaceae bacterium]|nr:6-bladed beta-propeller [Gemmatimonadaceae bacterium]
MRIHTPPFLAAGAAAVIAACAPGDSPRPVGQRLETDSAGAVIVSNVAPLWGEAPASLDSVPLVRIGREAAGPEQFTFVGLGLLLADDRIVVTELATSEVRVFSPTGVHQQTLGRRGDGPGEWQSISTLAPWAGDSLVTHDQRLRRITVHSLTSGGSRSVATPSSGNLAAFGLLADGGLLLYDPGRGYRPGAPPGVQWDTTDIVRVDITTGDAAVIARLPSREQRILPDGNTVPLGPAHRAVFAVDSFGFWWGTTDRYDVQFRDARGSLRRALRRTVDAEPVTPALTQRWIQHTLEEFARFNGPAAAAARRAELEAGPFGTRVPLFEYAFVDRNARLWLGAGVWPDEGDTPTRWSVFDNRGVWLGDVAVPPRFRPLDVRGDRVLGVVTDDDGVPFVEVRRLRVPE